MSEIAKTGGPAFPCLGNVAHNSDWVSDDGMTLREWFAGQALANAGICTGQAQEYELKHWFGEHTVAINRFQIVAAQAEAYADAMLAQLEKGRQS